MYYVYSLKCRNGYYVGCTDNIEDRLDRHQRGNVPATADRLPVSLEFYFATEDKYKAFQFEKYLKSGSGRGLFINDENFVEELENAYKHFREDILDNHDIFLKAKQRFDEFGVTHILDILKNEIDRHTLLEIILFISFVVY